MESGLLQHQFPFKCSPGFRSAFSTVCVRLPGIVPLRKAQRLILPSNFLEKEMSRLRVRFEFMSRFNVFLFLDGASHHQQRTPQAICWCSLWQQQNISTASHMWFFCLLFFCGLNSHQAFKEQGCQVSLMLFTVTV